MRLSVFLLLGLMLFKVKARKKVFVCFLSTRHLIKVIGREKAKQTPVSLDWIIPGLGMSCQLTIDLTCSWRKEHASSSHWAGDASVTSSFLPVSGGKKSIKGRNGRRGRFFPQHCSQGLFLPSELHTSFSPHIGNVGASGPRIPGSQGRGRGSYEVAVE